MSPWKPKQACPVCRRLGCTDPKHQREAKPMNWKTRRTPRPDFMSWPERRRRKQVVDEWVREYGIVCPQCGNRDTYEDGMPVQLTADHLHPIALGGTEQGPLGVLCRRCQTQQAAKLAAMRRRRPNG